jgi:hypothetical protein
VRPDQHASLTPERWSAFSLDQQILMIGNEMHRASKLFAAEDRERLLGSYERVLRLTELTTLTHSKPTLRRELMLWRGVIAGLYASPAPSPTTHRQALSVLLQFTPTAYAQTPYLGL